MSRYAFTLLCSLLLVQGGCTNPASMQATRLDSVRAGMTRDEVLEILGPPQRQEVYGSTEFLIYSRSWTSFPSLSWMDASRAQAANCTTPSFKPTPATGPSASPHGVGPKSSADKEMHLRMRISADGKLTLRRKSASRGLR